MLASLASYVGRLGHRLVQTLRRHLAAATKPVGPCLLVDTLADLPRSKPQLIAENALLRQQLLILRRSVTRPRCTPADRLLLVLLASCVRAWRHALLIVQPETILRWHRAAFRLWWRHKSRSTTITPRHGHGVHIPGISLTDAPRVEQRRAAVVELCVPPLVGQG